MRNASRIRTALSLAASVWLGACATARCEAAKPLRFELSFPSSVRAEPADGRVFVILSRERNPEPRLQTMGYGSPPFFAEDVDGLAPGAWAAVTVSSDGYPLASLSEIPAGEYWVQGMLNVYTTFRRADGHVLKMHMDQWEGQHLQKSPGNLYSEPKRIRLDPRAGGTVRLLLDRKIPGIEVPADTEYVRHLRFESPLLSKFWGHPIWIGATVLLPRGWAKEPQRRYPVVYEQGHFSTEPPGGFGEKLDLRADASEGEKRRARDRQAFEKTWLSEEFPRMLYVTFQHPTPYYDDSYAVDSANVGPYGRALIEELIPEVEKRFRAIPEPYARILTGGSTGGWEALALQIFHPDFFGGVFAACPDPVDFHDFQIVNIYEWDNAWHKSDGWTDVPLPGERSTDGRVVSTMEQQLKYERALGTHGRSGEQWDIWEAVFGPVGPDGYFQPLFDPKTGAIDRKVAEYWREHADLEAYLERRWKEIGPKLAGKIHVAVGEMDSFYLNNAVHRLESLIVRAAPASRSAFLYGPRQPHCWAGPWDLAQRMRLMADEVAAHAPAPGK